MATNLSGVTNKDEWIFSSLFWFSIKNFNRKSYIEREGERKFQQISCIWCCLIKYEWI
jgi:hypothetical protein